MSKLTAKQQRFVEEYCIDMNATQAAIRAGYSPVNANRIGSENLSKAYIKQRINERLEEMRTRSLATAQEVEAYLSAVMRGQSESQIVVVEGEGDGVSRAKKIMKLPDERERLKAAEILAKRHGLTDNKLTLEHIVPVVFAGENDLE